MDRDDGVFKNYSKGEPSMRLYVKNLSKQATEKVIKMEDFSKNGSFLKMLITQKIFVRISSNFLHSIRTSICIRKSNKNWGWFWSQFLF